MGNYNHQATTPLYGSTTPMVGNPCQMPPNIAHGKDVPHAHLQQTKTRHEQVGSVLPK